MAGSRATRRSLGRGGLALVTLVGALAGCSGPDRTVAWYRNHPAARAQAMAACRNERARIAPRGACINALAADSEAVSHRFWSSPPPASRVQQPGKL